MSQPHLMMEAVRLATQEQELRLAKEQRRRGCVTAQSATGTASASASGRISLRERFAHLVSTFMPGRVGRVLR